MNEEKWQNILSMIEDKFEIIEKGQNLPENKGVDKVEFIIFIGPLGKMKLEYLTKPVVLRKKTLYSKRAGSETAVDYEYSNTEKFNELKAFKWDDQGDNWSEIEGIEAFG